MNAITTTAAAVTPGLETAAARDAKVLQATTLRRPQTRSDPLSLKKGWQRFGARMLGLKQRHLLRSELLLPRIVTQDSGKLPPSMRLAETPARPELLPEFSKHEWGYYFPLGKGQSTLGPEKNFKPLQQKARNRCIYRLNIINDAIAALYGSNLAGKSVLDIGCNWGAFSIDMAVRNAGQVHGIDLREQNLVKASLLRDYLGVDSVKFSKSNVFDMPDSEQADIVLLLGLLYHVTTPYQLVKRAYEMTREMCVIDTVTHKEPFSGFILGNGQIILGSHASGEIAPELHPTYRGLIDLMAMVGFRNIIEVQGTPDPSWRRQGWNGDLYSKLLRRCLIGFK